MQRPRETRRRRRTGRLVARLADPTLCPGHEQARTQKLLPQTNQLWRPRQLPGTNAATWLWKAALQMGTSVGVTVALGLTAWLNHLGTAVQLVIWGVGLLAAAAFIVAGGRSAAERLLLECLHGYTTLEVAWGARWWGGSWLESARDWDFGAVWLLGTATAAASSASLAGRARRPRAGIPTPRAAGGCGSGAPGRRRRAARLPLLGCQTPDQSPNGGGRHDSRPCGRGACSTWAGRRRRRWVG